MAEQRRHMEFFGPDLSRGPFISNSPPVAAVQLATLLAQLRAPLSRAQADLESHADFIRSLANRLFPDLAQQIRFAVEPEAANVIASTIMEDSGDYSLLHCWLADEAGGGLSGTAPGDVNWSSGIVLEERVPLREYLVVTSKAGIAAPEITYTGNHTWYWAVERNGRVYYSPAIDFA